MSFFIDRLCIVSKGTNAVSQSSLSTLWTASQLALLMTPTSSSGRSRSWDRQTRCSACSPSDLLLLPRVCACMLGGELLSVAGSPAAREASSMQRSASRWTTRSHRRRVGSHRRCGTPTVCPVGVPAERPLSAAKMARASLWVSVGRPRSVRRRQGVHLHPAQPGR